MESQLKSDVLPELITDKPILVTGATGYIASHTIKILLERGYKVRGTVRSLENKAKYDFLYNLVPDSNDNLSLVEANLLDSAVWPSVVEGCDYVLHIASPIPPVQPKDEDELIKPAVEGTINVLEASLAKGVKRVIVTSSGLAIMNFTEQKVFDENDWATSEQYARFPYGKSKVLAEKATWDFYEKNKDKIEVIVINPGLVFGPVYTKHGTSSEAIVANFFEGKSRPGMGANSYVSIGDVRDIAEAEVRALTLGTSGKRYIIATDEEKTMGELIDVLRERYEKYGYTFPPKEVEAKPLRKTVLSNQRSITELKMSYHSLTDTMLDMGRTLIETGTVPDKRIT